MNNTTKTCIAASLALLVSFTMLFTYLDLYSVENPASIDSNKISSDNLGEKRILLIGSSYVQRLNATYIKQYLSENGLQQFQVYNIARNGAGNPSQQSAFLEQMVASHPSVIVYGLGFRELGYLPYTDNTPKCASGSLSPLNNQTSFRTPSIQDAAAYVSTMIPAQSKYLSNIADPKHVTVDILRSYFAENSSSTETNSSASGVLGEDFVEKRDPQFINIKSLDEINKPLDYVVRVCPEDMDNELVKLSEMVSVFKKNNVKVILFVPPFSSSYLNAVGDDGITQFLSTLKKFSSANGLNLYDLHDKYVNLDIWQDVQHVAKNPKVTVYSNDLAQIIFNELQSFTTLRTVDTSGDNLSYMDLSDADLRSVDLSGKNMTGVILAYSNLYGANTNGTILRGANLSHAYLHNMDLSDKDLTGVTLIGADLTGASLDGVDLSNKDLTGVNLSGVDLSDTDLDGAVLTGANMAHANLTGVDLSNKDLTGVNLSGVDLSDTDLDGAVLTGAIMDYSVLGNTALDGMNLTGASLKGVYLSGKDLTGTVLIGTNLAYANLWGDDLTGKNLTGTFLYKTNFSHADLTGADLSGVNLRNTVFTGANLNNANLYYADLSGNDLTSTTLVGANLRNAVLPDANLAYKDLTGTVLAGSNLVRANLTGVDLSYKDMKGTNLRGTLLDYSVLVGVNLGMKNMTGASLQGADLTRAVLWKADMVRVNLSDSSLSHSDMRYAVVLDSNLAGADMSAADLSGAYFARDDLTGTVVAGTNLKSANLTDVDVSKTVTEPVAKLSGPSNAARHSVIDDFQSGNGWLKQSPTGIQSYDAVDFVNGSQSLKLVTEGNGSPTTTHSNLFSPPLDLRQDIVSVWMKVGNSSKVSELWIYFTSDAFKSSWYTYKIPISESIQSGEWTKVSFALKDAVVTGSPDMSMVDRLQIRINDDSTGPVTLHVNEISIQKEVQK